MKKQTRNLLFVAFATVLMIMVILPLHAVMAEGPVTYTVTVGGDLPHPGGESMYMGYGPSVAVIRAGDTIVWKALDGPHTVTAENLTADGKPIFDSHPKVAFPLPPFIFGPGGFIPPGGRYVLDTSTLSPGTYGFLCTIHQDSNMQGALTVTNETAPTGYQFTVVTGATAGPTEIEQFMPNNITVPWGTKVIFQDLSGFEVHTVVSFVTLPNGTRVLGTLFDSSPIIAPPGITWDQVPQVNMEGVNMLGGAMFPLPGLNTFNYTFNTPGTYLYYCKYHSAVENGNIAGMVGEVIVMPSYASTDDLMGLNNQVTSAASQVGTATALGGVGVLLGVIAVVIAVWASRKNRKAS